MSTEYTGFTNLSFTNIFARGADGREVRIINSAGIFVGTVATTSALSCSSVTVNAGTAAAPSVAVGSASLGLYKAASKQLGIAAGGVNIATVTTAALLVAKAVTATGAVTGSNLSGTHSGTSSGTNTGDQTITLTGNVTGTGTGSFATTIANSAVTNVMIASTAAISGSKIASASSSAAGVVSTGAQSFAGAKTFTTALAGSNVVSASSSASGVITTGAQSIAGNKTVVGIVASYNIGSMAAKSADYTITDSDGFSAISMTTSSTSRVVTLPAAANNLRRVITVKKADSATGKVTVTGTINGTSNFLLVDQDDYVSVMSNGTSYDIIAKGIGYRVVSRVRDEGANGHGSTNTKIRRIDNASVVNTGNAITRAVSSTAGNSYTINQSGMYAISYCDRRTDGATVMGISLSSSQLTTSIDTVTNTTRIAMTQTATSQANGFCSTSLYLASGSVIRPHTDGTPNVGTAVDCNFEISKIGI